MKRQKEALNETLKQEFKKDLELFEYFLVLLNSSSPIRNVELMWADDLELFDPTQRPRVNTGDALVQLTAGGRRCAGAQFSQPQHTFLRPGARFWRSRRADLRAERQAGAKSDAAPPAAATSIPATSASRTLRCR